MKKYLYLLIILTGCEGSIFSDKKAALAPAPVAAQAAAPAAYPVGQFDPQKKLERRDVVVSNNEKIERNDGRTTALVDVYALFRTMSAPSSKQSKMSDGEMDKLNNYELRFSAAKDGVREISVRAPEAEAELKDFAKLNGTVTDSEDPKFDPKNSIYLVARDPKFTKNRIVFRLDRKNGKWAGWARHDVPGTRPKKTPLSQEFNNKLIIEVE